MPQANVTLSVRQVAPSVSIIDIHGEINGFAEEALMRAYAQANTPGTRVVIMNFSGLEYMNSSGIGLLVTLLIRIKRNRQQLLAYGLSDHYRQIFELTRLNDAIGVYTSEAEALAAARGM
jgi:anti-sigma B factor antagonist